MVRVEPTFIFLGDGTRGLLDGRTWPRPAGDRPGDWVRGDDRAPIRGYLVEDLPHWLDDELWEVELAGPIEPVEHALRAERGRLTRRVSDWSAATAWSFVEAVTERARELAVNTLRTSGRMEAATRITAAAPAELVAVGDQVAAGLEGLESELAVYPADCRRYAQDAHTPGAAAAVAGYVAAHAAGRAAPDYETAAAAERAWQGRWLAARLGLGRPV